MQNEKRLLSASACVSLRPRGISLALAAVAGRLALSETFRYTDGHCVDGARYFFVCLRELRQTQASRCAPFRTHKTLATMSERFDSMGNGLHKIY